MKTPCEESGYKVGDKFEVINTKEYFSLGSIVELYEDDRTVFPLFKLISGNCELNLLPDGCAGAYAKLSSMNKIQDASDTTANKPEEEQKKQPNTDIRWAKIPNEEMPDSFFEDIAVMFEGLPLEHFLYNYGAGSPSFWKFIGFNGNVVEVFNIISGRVEEGGYEIPYQYAKDIQKQDEEDQDELDKAFDLLEKRLKLKADLDNKTSSAVSTLTQMGFKYVDGKWTFNGGE